MMMQDPIPSLPDAGEAHPLRAGLEIPRREVVVQLEVDLVGAEGVEEDCHLVDDQL